MYKSEELKNILKSIDGKSYNAYHKIKGGYNFGIFNFYIDYVQGDPFARPSKVRIRIDQKIAQFPPDTHHNESRNTALCDFLLRSFYRVSQKIAEGNRGSGNSGIITAEKPSQEILDRSAVFVSDKCVELRFVLGLAAYGRRISAHNTGQMFFKEIPEIVNRALLFERLDKQKLYNHIKVSEDADFIRCSLKKLKIISFIADGSLLPRASGIDDRVLKMRSTVSFKTDKNFKVAINLPNGGEISGMGVPQGITLIVGGGFHGKSTLLNAIEKGVYNHIPGDGREYVVTDPDAVKIRAMDGRSIKSVNISPFINNLPFGKDTTNFSTENASGSTSQAATIIEAFEMGVKTLLIDEDTSATNFMIRDHRMQELIAKENEPITPFIDKVRQLFKEHSISTILVIGGSGDYFGVADTVIAMHDYLPEDRTKQALHISNKYKSERKEEGGNNFGETSNRIPDKLSINPSKGKKNIKIGVPQIDTIIFGENSINISDLEQIVCISQTKTIADAINYAKKYMDGTQTLSQIIEKVIIDIKSSHFDIFNDIPSGEYALFRKYELAGTINRLRSLKVFLGKP